MVGDDTLNQKKTTKIKGKKVILGANFICYIKEMSLSKVSTVKNEVKEFTDKKFFMKSKVHITMGSFYVMTTSDQKKPFVDVLRNRCSLKFRKIHRKTPVLESLLIKFQALMPATISKRGSNTGVFLLILRNL